MTTQEETQMQEAFDQAYEDMGEGKSPELTQSFTTPLGMLVREYFGEAERDRYLIEQRWLEDLRQNRAEYDDATTKKIHPLRSKAFLSLTRSKIKTVTSRMNDILFPAHKEKNWGITPTPIPELSPDLITDLISQAAMQKIQMTEEDLKKDLNKEAKRRCEAMEKEMEDQLVDLRYRETIRDVVRNGNLYGTGVLKGPLAKQKIVKRWVAGPDGQWVTLKIKTVLPHLEAVSIWDVYPDMQCRNLEDAQFVIQRHVMNRKQLQELINRDDFNGDVIRDYMRTYEKGDWQIKNHENQLKLMSSGQEQPIMFGNRAKYELLEFWGYIPAKKLQEANLEIDENQLGEEIACTIWVLGNTVIKAVISPIEGVSIPYYFYYYDKDETSIFGEGLAYIMRDPQRLFNASTRAMIDHAAITAGPIFEINMDLLKEENDPLSIYPFRVFLRTGVGAEASAQAVRVYPIPSALNQYMELARFFLDMADEVTTVPRYMYGDVQSVRGGASRTATGLSMLMGAANITLKDQIKNFDEGITKPFIRSLYFWNMEFNTKPEIKGDFDVVAKGSTSLIAREVKMESLNQFMAITANPVDNALIKRDSLLREVAKIMDLDDADLIKDPITVTQEQQVMNQQMAEDKAFEKELAMMKAKSGGHMPESSTEGTPTGRPSMEGISQEALQGGAIPEVSGGPIESI